MLTSEEELRNLCVRLMPMFMEYLRTHQAAIEQVELATTRDGIRSFPATQELGGVLKTVRVPLSLLTRDIDEAEQYAREQGQYARAQGDYAKGQGDRVDTAIDTLAEVSGRAEAAAANANGEAARAGSATERTEAARRRAESLMALLSANDQERAQLWQEMMDHPLEEGENGNFWAWSLETHSRYDTGIVAGGSVLYPLFVQDVDDGGLYMYYASSLELARFAQDESDGALYFYPSGNAPTAQESSQTS